jgi:hypothetical protein
MEVFMSSIQEINDLISYISTNFPEGIKENQSPSSEQIAKIQELSEKIIGNKLEKGYTEGDWRVGRIGDTRLVPQSLFQQQIVPIQPMPARMPQPTTTKPACRDGTFPCFHREPPKMQYSSVPAWRITANRNGRV